MTDIADLFETSEKQLAIKRPDGSDFLGSDGQPFTITLAGPTHAQSFRAEELVRLRYMKQMADKEPETEGGYIDRVLEPLILRTITWSPVSLNGAPFLFTPENAKTLYQSSDLIRRQVEGYIVARQNFLKPPSTN